MVEVRRLVVHVQGKAALVGGHDGGGEIFQSQQVLIARQLLDSELVDPAVTEDQVVPI